MPLRAPAHVYVYYRVVADATAARAAVAALFVAVTRATGVDGRLLARCDDAQTWMEVYEPIGDPDDFGRRLAMLVAEHGIAAFAVDGIRHVECFRALPGVDPTDARPGAARTP